MIKYGVKSLVVSGEGDERLNEALRDGWEPFAVVAVDGPPAREIWFRRNSQNNESTPC